MRLVEYRRVSSRGQVRDGYGLTVQAKDNRAFAKANGHRIVKVCSDDAVKGALPAQDRPGLQCALDAIAEGKADALLTGKLDRLARALTVQEAVLAQVWQMGGKVFTADAGEVLPDDPDDPMRTAIRQMMGVFAELDRRMVVKRLRDGQKAKAAAGKHATGLYPLGYHGAGKGRERDAVPFEPEQEAVRRIVQLRQDGKSYREIAAVLEAEGIKPRKAAHWSAMTIRQVWVRESTRS